MSDLIKWFSQLCSKERRAAMTQKQELEKSLADTIKVVGKETRKGDDTLCKLIVKLAEERTIPDFEARIFLANQRVAYIDEFEQHGVKLLQEEKNE